MKICKFISMMTVSMFLVLGCSTKNPSVKTGIISGGVSGILVGGLLGASLSNTHGGNGNTLQGVLIVGSILGLAGAGLGAGMGYVIDATQVEKEMNEIRESQNIVEIQE